MATDNDNDNENAPATGGPANTNDNANEDEREPTQAESEMTESIAKDRPTIDAAVKSFIGMVCARSMAASNSDKAKTTGSAAATTTTISATATATATTASTEQQQDKVMMGIIPGLAQTSISAAQSPASTTTTTTTTTTAKDDNGSASAATKSTSTTQQRVLQLARLVLKSVNSHTFPVHDTVAYSMAEKPGTTPQKKAELLEISVVARLWNALVESDQKPSRFLGRRALRLAWKQMDIGASLGPPENGDDDHDRERQLEWLQQFEVLLFESCKPLPSDIKVDDDSALLWAPDGGASELAKRRQRRLAAAKERGPSTPS